MNSDIQIIDMVSDDPVDCSPTEPPGDEMADTVLVTVITLGVAEMVTTLLTVAVVVTDCTSVLVLVVMAVDVTVDVVVLVTSQVPVRVKCCIK